MIAAGLGIFLSWTTEGSIGARIARLQETSTAELARDDPGVYHVISDLEFAGFDVGCVVIALAGIFAVATKTMTSIEPARQLEPVFRQCGDGSVQRKAR